MNTIQSLCIFFLITLFSTIAYLFGRERGWVVGNTKGYNEARHYFEDYKESLDKIERIIIDPSLEPYDRIRKVATLIQELKRHK